MLISAVASGRDNNLNLLRILAAFGVLVSHAFPISLGSGSQEPLSQALGMTLGSVCVAVFFVISGFLISQSAARSRSLWLWSAGRILRLMPALIVVVVLTALILGPMVTTLAPRDYFSDPQVAQYILRNISLFRLQYALPGVFEDNPVGPTINGSLWTLFYEVLCYLGVFLLALIGALRSAGRLATALLFYFVVYAFLRYTGKDQAFYQLKSFLDLSFPFCVGMLLYALKARVRLSWTYGAGLAAFAFLTAAYTAPVFREVFLIVLAYWVFLVGYMPAGAIRQYNRVGDYSYGTYIYAFPMQQLAVWMFGPMTPVENMAIALPMTLVLAALSWHLVEKPAMSRRMVMATAMAKLTGNRLRPTESKN